MLINVILLIIFAFEVFMGWKKGLTGALLGIARIIVSIIVSIAFGKVLGETIVGDGKFIASAVGYILAFLITYAAATVVIFIVKKIKIPVVHTIDKILGIVIGAVLGIIAVAFVSQIIMYFCNAMTTVTGDASYNEAYAGSALVGFINKLHVFDFINNLIFNR